jgi:hypothetical protein
VFVTSLIVANEEKIEHYDNTYKGFAYDHSTYNINKCYITYVLYTVISKLIYK